MEKIRVKKDQYEEEEEEAEEKNKRISLLLKLIYNLYEIVINFQ